MAVVKAQLARESHPTLTDAFGPYHYVFSPACLKRFAEQAIGMPVTVNFDGKPVGCVTGAQWANGHVTLEMDLDESVIERIASPAFIATDNQWTEDYSDRVIRMADLKGIGMTDD
jgi:hypothetical protein